MAALPRSSDPFVTVAGTELAVGTLVLVPCLRGETWVSAKGTYEGADGAGKKMKRHVLLTSGARVVVHKDVPLLACAAGDEEGRGREEEGAAMAAWRVKVAANREANPDGLPLYPAPQVPPPPLPKAPRPAARGRGAGHRG